MLIPHRHINTSVEMPVENLLVDGNGPVFMRCSPLCTKYGAAREDSTNWHSISSQVASHAGQQNAGWGYDWSQSCNLLQCSIDILVADDVHPSGRHDRSPAQATPTMQQHRAPPNILANRIDDGVKTVRLQGPERRNLSVSTRNSYCFAISIKTSHCGFGCQP